MEDVNSPNDKVQWATDKTTNNSISYKRASTQTSVVFTRCVLVVKTNDHIELNDLHKKDDHCYLNVIQSLGTTQDLIQKNKKHLWKSTGMAIS